MKKVFQTSLLVLFALAIFFSINIAHAAASTYYASTSGNDSNTGTLSSPFRTISKGGSVLAPGDTLLVRGGTYDEHITSMPSGTSWGNIVRVANYPGETVWLTPTVQGISTYAINLSAGEHYVEFDGINIDATVRPGGANRWCGGAFRVESWTGGNAHHIRYKNATVVGPKDGVTDPDNLSGCDGIAVLLSDSVGGIGGNEFTNLKIHGGGEPGEFAYCFYIQSDDNIVDNLDCYDMGEAGIQIYVYYGTNPSNNIVRNSRIHDIRASQDGRATGIIIAGANNKIYNNLVYNIPNSSNTNGIFPWSGYASGNEIYNNTVYNVLGNGISLDSTTSNSTVKNNIAFGNTTDYKNDASGTICSNNLFGNGSACSGSISSNPNFVSALASNFQLNSGSPAINAGAILSLFTTDITGASRAGNYDLGAYEYGGTVTPPPQPPPSPTVSATLGAARSVTVTWSNPAQTATMWDWLALTTSSSQTELDWRNTNCTQDIPTALVPSGSCTFTINSSVPAGTYVFKFYANNSYTVLATSQPITLSATSSPLAGDFNLDHIVNGVDWSYMNSKWFGSDATADLNKDGVVNAIDFSLLNVNWQKTW